MALMKKRRRSMRCWIDPALAGRSEKQVGSRKLELELLDSVKPWTKFRSKVAERQMTGFAG